MPAPLFGGRRRLAPGRWASGKPPAMPPVDSTLDDARSMAEVCRGVALERAESPREYGPTLRSWLLRHPKLAALGEPRPVYESWALAVRKCPVAGHWAGVFSNAVEGGGLAVDGEPPPPPPPPGTQHRAHINGRARGRAGARMPARMH